MSKVTASLTMVFLMGIPSCSKYYLSELHVRFGTQRPVSPALVNKHHVVEDFPLVRVDDTLIELVWRLVGWFVGRDTPLNVEISSGAAPTARKKAESRWWNVFQKLYRPTLQHQQPPKETV